LTTTLPCPFPYGELGRPAFPVRASSDHMDGLAENEKVNVVILRHRAIPSSSMGARDSAPRAHPSRVAFGRRLGLGGARRFVLVPTTRASPLDAQGAVRQDLPLDAPAKAHAEERRGIRIFTARGRRCAATAAGRLNSEFRHGARRGWLVTALGGFYRISLSRSSFRLPSRAG
jgi:hypothetical protein